MCVGAGTLSGRKTLRCWIRRIFGKCADAVLDEGRQSTIERSSANEEGLLKFEKSVNTPEWFFSYWNVITRPICIGHKAIKSSGVPSELNAESCRIECFNCCSPDTIDHHPCQPNPLSSHPCLIEAPELRLFNAILKCNNDTVECRLWISWVGHQP